MGKKQRAGAYAVSRGRKTGVFSTWSECSQQVHGFPGAVYKGFATSAEAQKWLDKEALLVSGLPPRRGDATGGAQQPEVQTGTNSVAAGIEFEDLHENQQEAVRLAQNGECFFFTGTAGTGKSTTIEFIKSVLMREGRHFALTASTGAAAVLIGGSTLHSWAKVGLAKDDPYTLVSRMGGIGISAWINTQALIIDECSMISADLFEKLHEVGCRIRNNYGKLFGGIQVILTGDFGQLPPVQRTGQRRYLFESPLWKRFIKKTVVLTKVHRQSHTFFVDLLQKVRMGTLDDAAVKAIQATSSHLQDTGDGIEPTILFSKNVDVDSVNADALAKLPGNATIFRSQDSFLNEDTRKRFLRSTRLAERLDLKVGAQVMLLKNLDVDNGLCNGSRGVVRAIHGNSVEIFFKTGPDTGVLKCLDRETDAWVRKVDDGREKIILASRSQFPLRLCWAMTIHKSQGMTCNWLEVDLEGCFEKGQAYVALSRAVDYNQMRVKNFQPYAVMTDPKVKAFHEQLFAAQGIRQPSEVSPTVAGSLKPVSTSPPKPAFVPTPAASSLVAAKPSMAQEVQQPSPPQGSSKATPAQGEQQPLQVAGHETPAKDPAQAEEQGPQVTGRAEPAQIRVGSFALLGTFRHPSRSRVTEVVKAAGGTLVANMTKSCSALVLGSKMRNSKAPDTFPRYKQAVQWGIPIVTGEELLAQLTGKRPAEQQLTGSIAKVAKSEPVSSPASPPDDPIRGKTFVVTGIFDNGEDKTVVMGWIVAAGGLARQSVTTKTDYLVVGSFIRDSFRGVNRPIETSAKLQKALKLGVRVLKEPELRAMLPTTPASSQP
ncbi:ATP-dependent DNA helicase PIF1 (DNA repair and recombination helicase PIF1) (PIF1/RRM3 DNA helicase-like protein) [Durusdinium trenchii]|uniref:ATP-dependent DNA helicase n=1 Tax=Durusdinium trenchii TaxID=1381693 RepID=A0ABP0QWN3_9DINO